MTAGGRTTTRRAPAILLAWLTANAVLGWLLLLPLLIIDMVVRFVVGSLIDAPWIPFERDHDAVGAVAFYAVLIGAPLVATAVFADRRVEAKLKLRGRPAAAYWVVSLAVLIAPYLAVVLEWVTVRQAVGKGVWW